MITGHSDPLMCFYAHNLARISIESMAKPGGAMLPLAPPLLPHSKTRGCTAPPCSPPLASLNYGSSGHFPKFDALSRNDLSKC